MDARDGACRDVMLIEWLVERYLGGYNSSAAAVIRLMPLVIQIIVANVVLIRFEIVAQSTLLVQVRAVEACEFRRLGDPVRMTGDHGLVRYAATLFSDLSLHFEMHFQDRDISKAHTI